LCRSVRAPAASTWRTTEHRAFRTAPATASTCCVSGEHDDDDDDDDDIGTRLVVTSELGLVLVKKQVALQNARQGRCARV
jgi:hypothetical protein